MADDLLEEIVAELGALTLENERFQRELNLIRTELELLKQRAEHADASLDTLTQDARKLRIALSQLRASASQFRANAAQVRADEAQTWANEKQQTADRVLQQDGASECARDAQAEADKAQDWADEQQNRADRVQERADNAS